MTQANRKAWTLSDVREVPGRQGRLLPGFLCAIGADGSSERTGGIAVDLGRAALAAAAFGVDWFGKIDVASFETSTDFLTPEAALEGYLHRVRAHRTETGPLKVGRCDIGFVGMWLRLVEIWALPEDRSEVLAGPECDLVAVVSHPLDPRWGMATVLATATDRQLGSFAHLWEGDDPTEWDTETALGHLVEHGDVPGWRRRDAGEVRFLPLP